MASGKWEKDIDNVLLEFGVTKESMQEDAAEKLESILQNYIKVINRYCSPGVPEQRSGVYCCPACGKRIQYHHSYCHKCGKRVGWDK